MPRPKPSTDVKSQRAVVKRVEAEIRAHFSERFLNLLLYAYGVDGGLRPLARRKEKELQTRVDDLNALLDAELDAHERLHQSLDCPRRQLPAFDGPKRKGARRSSREFVQGDIDTRLPRKLARRRAKAKRRGATRSRQPARVAYDLEQPDTWGSEICDDIAVCTSISKTVHAHAYVIRALGQRLDEAKKLLEQGSALTLVLDEHPCLGSKGEILSMLKEELRLEWLDIVTFFARRQMKKRLPIRASYLADAAASARQMASKFRQSELRARVSQID
jgi:hypothetical protein